MRATSRIAAFAFVGKADWFSGKPEKPGQQVVLSVFRPRLIFPGRSLPRESSQRDSLRFRGETKRVTAVESPG